LEREPLVILARREGVGLHDAVLSGCREAGFTPKIAHTPSLIGTVLSYVESGVGIGVVTEGILNAGGPLRFVPLVPVLRVPLVLVWQQDGETELVMRFRELLGDWMKRGLVWRGA
jgi:DNA-binding transcriptional LysR family regulator